MTLWRKTFNDSGAVFSELSDDEEASVRAAIVSDGSSGPLLFVDSGMECVYTDDQAASIREERAASVAAQSARVPKSVTTRQFRRALRQAGLRDAVEAAIANADEETQDTWEYAVTIERNHPMLIAMAASLSVTSEKLDDLFRLAVTL